MIHNLRKQPEHVRRNILHILIAICAVLLVFLWIFTLGTNLTSPDTQTKISQDLKPFSAIKSNLEGGYNDLSQPNQNDSGSSTDSDLKTQENNL